MGEYCGRRGELYVDYMRFEVTLLGSAPGKDGGDDKGRCGGRHVRLVADTARRGRETEG